MNRDSGFDLKPNEFDIGPLVPATIDILLTCGNREIDDALLDLFYPLTETLDRDWGRLLLALVTVPCGKF